MTRVSNDIGELGRLKPAPGATKKRKRIGRGRGSGHGDTATKGHKGAQSRSGYRANPGFEGGQMPLVRRIPKRGFNVPNRTIYREVKLGSLTKIAGDAVNPQTIRSARLIKGRGPIVILGNGDIDRPVQASVHRITSTAREKIIAAGGTVEILPLEPIDLRVKRGPKKKNRTNPKAKKAAP